MLDDLYAELGFAPPRRPDPGARPRVDPLSRPEEDSLLGRIAGAGLGGIGYIGSALEKTFGGRAIRAGLGTLAGMDVAPSEFLSMIPGSDLVGLTDPANRVGGREILRHAGIAGPEDNWGNFAGGLGLELATDPASYLSFGTGALTQGGRVAKAAGVLPETAAGRVGTTLNKLHSFGPPTPALSDALAASGKTLAEIGDLPLGYSVGFGLPFGRPAFGLGESGLQAAGAVGSAVKGADALARQVPFLGSQYGHTVDALGTAADWLGRQAKAVFQPSVMEATTKLGQEVSPEAHSLARSILAERKMRAANYAEELKAAGVNDPTGSVLRSVAEGTYQGAAHPVIEQVASRMKADLASDLSRLQGLGVDVAAMTDLEAGYLPRYMSPLAKPSPGHGGTRQPLLAADRRVSGRDPIFKDVVGGTEGVNQLVLDPLAHGPDPMQSAAHIRSRYLSQGLAPEQAESQAQGLADWVRGLDPQYHASIGTPNPLRFFGNHPLADYESYYDKASRLLGAGEATQNLLARGAQPLATYGNLPPGSVRLTEALRTAGLTNDVGAQATALQRLNAARSAQGLPPAQFADLSMQYVPKEYVDEVTRFLRPFSAPDAVSNLGRAADTVTNLTKAYQTAPWLPFHIRNLASGLWQNWAKGAGEAPGGLPKQVSDAYRLLQGEVLPDAAQIAEYTRRGLSPEQATRELAKEMYAFGVGGHMPHLGREIAGPAGGLVSLGPDLEGFLARIPGQQPKTLTEAAQTFIGQAPGQTVSWNPINVAGVGSSIDMFPPVAGGRALGDIVEGVNRGSQYLSLRRQGFTAEQAAKEVLGTHFDYTRAGKTATEAGLLSRVFPYWTYTRGNVPSQIEQVLQRPGGPAGVAARVAQDLRQDAGFLPAYLGGGLAVPVGEEQDGTRRYLSRLDLPPEQAFEWLRAGPQGVQNTLAGILGQMNPWLKAPVEMATNKQLYSGRALDDLYTMTGVPALETLLMNSPASRVATTLRTVTDPRKWEDPLALPINLLSGAKLTDVDMEKQRSIAEKEYLSQALNGLPEIGKFQTIYLKPGMEPFLQDWERELLRLNKTVEQRAQEKARQNRGSRP